MQKIDLVSGIFWLAFAALVSVLSYLQQVGTLREPGPGFLFFYCGLLLGFMSLIMIVSSLRMRSAWKPLSLPFKGLNLKKLIPVVLSLFLYVALMETLGFVVGTFLILIFLLRIIEKKPWRLSLTTSVLVTACSYLLFQYWLAAQLPRGLLGLIQM
ncbi:MAG: hypothetical protein CVU57_23200 [Deltaproteobacteria bacterium HGW-Deltaproteobacteria-15]|jgi:putative tricarboxylic transport membrane protein|nr:MAG: hypothetical protein CVU57_23200 [Deltaproteobacteria bacterium HGW-Deltaproteobacteria-15]